MNKILLLALTIVFMGCSQDVVDEKKVTKIKTQAVKSEVVSVKTVKPIKAKSKVLNDIATVRAQATTKTGSQIFMKCAGCHGQNAEKSALAKSQIIKGWDKEKVKTAINGYKDGSYGGAMKGLMKGQVGTLSKEDVDLVAEYISKL